MSTPTREQIEAEFDAFIEYPTDDKRYISTVSAKLFAEHIARIAFNAGRERGLGGALEVCKANAKRWPDLRGFYVANECAAAIEQLRA